MSNQHWKKITTIDDLETTSLTVVKVGEEDILLIRRHGQVLGIGATCAHYGAPLAEGMLIDQEIVCPWHGARFDIESGRATRPPALNDLKRYSIKVQKRDVLLGPEILPSQPAPANEQDKRVFVIVGAGAAGDAAAEMLRNEGFGGRIVMLTKERELPYDRPNLSKGYLDGDTPLEWMPLRQASFYPEHGIEVMTDTRVTKVDPRAKTITTDKREVLRFDKLLLATGGVPRPLNIPGDGLPGCFALRTLDDAKAILRAQQDAKTALVLGAGFIGLEIASSLVALGLSVHVVAPEKIPLSRVFGDRLGNWLAGLHEKNGVQFHLGTQVRELTGEFKVHRAILADGSRLSIDFAIAGLGIDPATDFLEGTGLVENGYVTVDSHLKTRIEDIFAAGDIAAFPDPHTGTPRQIEHWIVAQTQGKHAARSMLGSAAPYDDVPLFWTRQFDVSLLYAGFPGETDETALRGSLEDGTFMMGYFQEGMLRAVAGVGQDLQILALQELLKRDDAPSRQEFEDPQTDFRARLL